MSDYIPLDSQHVLRVQSLPDRPMYAGEVIMLSASGDPSVGTSLFVVPVHHEVTELTNWAKDALKAFKEG